MDEADLYSLNAVSGYITENLDAKYISDQLIEKEVLDVDHDEEIQAEKTAKRRTERLLEILPDTRRDALKLFKEALEKDYPHILKKLNDVQVPDQLRTGTKPGKGGLRTAAAATSATKVASSTDRGVTTTTATRNRITSRTTNIRGNNNMVIIGGSNTTINHYR